MTLGRRILTPFERKQPDGLFDVLDVLDYDSTLELLDSTGQLAIFKRRQNVRFFQDHIITFQDYTWVMVMY